MNIKKALSLLILLMATTLLYSFDYQTHGASSGDWVISGNRVVQKDAEESIAKAYLRAPQAGEMEYAFTLRYIDGLQDSMGGVGLHVFIDKPSTTRSWGEGESWLLWLNYDESPVLKGIQPGFTAQVWHSTEDWDMELIESVDLNDILPSIPEEFLYTQIPFRLRVNGNNGLVKIYNPLNQNEYWTLQLPIKKAMTGEYVSLRTNSMSIEGRL